MYIYNVYKYKCAYTYVFFRVYGLNKYTKHVFQRGNSELTGISQDLEPASFRT